MILTNSRHYKCTHYVIGALPNSAYAWWPTHPSAHTVQYVCMCVAPHSALKKSTLYQTTYLHTYVHIRKIIMDHHTMLLLYCYHSN